MFFVQNNSFARKIKLRNLKENMEPLILEQNEIALSKKKEEKLLAKKFFPPFLLKMKYGINLIFKIYPKLSYFLTAKLLSVTGKKKLSANAIIFYKQGVKGKVKVDGATFYTYTYGNGPLILMLHGWCSNAARWKVYVNELVNLGFKVMVVDAPGHGTAPGRFLSFFKYAKGIKAILKSESEWYGVVTHSIAGLTAITAIGKTEKKHHPSKFIMMNTFANATTILEKFSNCLGISEEVIKYTKEQMFNFLDFPLSEFSIGKHYNNLNLEGLLVYDTKDVVVPLSESEQIIKNIKSLRTFKTEGLGHNLKSDRVVKVVVGFMKSETNATTSSHVTYKEYVA